MDKLEFWNTIGLIVVGLITVWNNRKTAALQVNVDGRLTQLLELTDKSSKAKGDLEGHARAKEEEKVRDEERSK